MISVLLALLAAAGLYYGSIAGSAAPALEANLENLDGSPQEIRRLAELAGLNEDWADFLVAKAWIESRWNPYSARGVQPGAPVWLPKINDGPNDAFAAKKAYERQRFERGLFQNSPWPTERYTFGTFGLWQLIPANSIASAFKGTEYENIDPWSQFVPSVQMAMAVDYNLGLMKRSAYKQNPTWETVYAGWSKPGNMSNLDSFEVQAALDRFREGLSASGIPASFMKKKPSPAPSGLQVMNRIGFI